MFLSDLTSKLYLPKIPPKFLRQNKNIKKFDGTPNKPQGKSPTILTKEVNMRT